ncbi:discoidin/SUN/FTP domain-containing protein [Plastoroseomonas arctica]|uniref:F5/8 type C domain-containing protein n=1 Tax=Plastoroseomonas arctica TaxID=1509237 RepID=A0AAF1JWV2_9PROT|nr:hypothetical protein [Plastoroseomonas arctica]MBR0655082.1 hypothetical protein [Plastoroseomonas arctica]
MSDGPASGIEIRLDAGFDLAGWVNIAPGKACAQSTLSRWSHMGGAAALVDPPRQADFAIHTEFEANPWWSIDLGGGHRDLVLRVYNRGQRSNAKQDNLRGRALPLVVQLSEDGIAWTALVDVAQEFGDVASGAPLSIRLHRRDDQPAIRFVRLAVRQPRTALHLQLVQVFVPEAVTGPHPPAEEADLQRVFHERVAPFGTFEDARRRYDGDRLSFFPGHAFGAIDAVQTLRIGRLGNRIIGTMNALLFAQVHGIGRVYLSVDDFRDAFGVPESLRYGDIEILVRKPEAGENAFLMMSRFYYGHYVPAAVERDPIRLAAILRDAVRPILLPGLEDGALDAGTVVIHIRSGDVFQGVGGHVGYVQPPLSYYVAALEHAAREHPVDQVVVVHEDRANPTIAALEAYLSAAGIGCTMQSSTLREDTATIFGARRIISGHGTFVAAVIAQSVRVETLYFFRRVMLPQLFDAQSPRIFVAHDTARGFTRYGDWANTAEQRQLMLDYPRTGLTIRPYLPKR